VKYFNFVAAVLLSLLYATGKIPPSEKYNLWFTIFIIPVAMVANTVLLLATLIMRKKSSAFYIIPMIIGIPYMLGTLGMKGYFKSSEAESTSFTVLNYNIGGYRGTQMAHKNQDSARIELTNMILHPDTDIQCYQEFATYPWHKDFNVIGHLRKLNRMFYFSEEEDKSHADYSTAGILIVSRFPIVGHGEILSSNHGFNRVAYADIKIGKDTVRIINVHLESMGLSQHDPRVRHDLGSVRKSTLSLLSKLKSGVFERSKQARQVAAFVEASPYPVVCVGDFNDMPYSYSYQYLKRFMRNAFEESGRGFGFTYNGGTLKMLRIDNQFHTAGVESTVLKTRYDISLTDHFPVQGTYNITRDN